MNRSDWVSIAVTLIAIAVSYYLGGPRTALYCGIAGVAILFVLMLCKHRKKDESSSSTAQFTQQIGSPVLTQNANPTINVNIGNRHPSQEPRAQAARPDATPNIKFVETRPLDIYVSENKFCRTQDGLGDFRIAVVCFRNDGILGKEVREPDVRAHLIYRDANGQEIADVPRAVWLDEYKDYVSFTLGEKRCLILYLLSNQGTLKILWKESYTHEHSWMGGGPSFRVRDEAIRGRVVTVEILLLAESSGICLMQSTFEVESFPEGELPKLTLKR